MNTTIPTKYNNLDQDQIDLIKRTIAKNATNDELNLFLYYCNKTGLDPLAHQIWFIKMNGQLNIQVSIDGLRLVAERSGLYAGQDGAIFTVEEIDGRKDLRCDVTVYKFAQSGERYPVATGSAYLSEYSSNNPLWKTKPRVMLSKVAESLALRKGFPLELSGIYTPEEFSTTTSTPNPIPSIDKSSKKKETIDSYPEYEDELDISIEEFDDIKEFNKQSDIKDASAVYDLDEEAKELDKLLDVPLEDRKFKEGDRCPNCETQSRIGHLKLRKGNFGEFLGCDQFPECSFTYKFKK